VKGRLRPSNAKITRRNFKKNVHALYILGKIEAKVIEYCMHFDIKITNLDYDKIIIILIMKY